MLSIMEAVLFSRIRVFLCRRYAISDLIIRRPLFRLVGKFSVESIGMRRPSLMISVRWRHLTVGSIYDSVFISICSQKMSS